MMRPAMLALALLVAIGAAAQVRGFGPYAYDGAGNITQVGADTFDYDRFGRINTATIAGIRQAFTYDVHGNITAIATTGENDRTIGVNAKNQLSAATYDLSGNLIGDHRGTFVYDGLNAVKEFTPTNGNRHLYLYSASNERIATIEILPGGQQESDWTIRDDAGKILRRYKKHSNGAWSWEEDYIYRGTLLLAAEVPGSEKVRHFHLDHLGTPRAITGNGGAIIAERTYSAFGRGLIVQSTPPPDELAQFTAHERDNFQLDYMHARYYDPTIGRFLSVDPSMDLKANLARPQRWNRYSYVSNSPINKIDPDGRDEYAMNQRLLGVRDDWHVRDKEDARTLGSMLVSAMPGVGEVYDGISSVTGKTSLEVKTSVPSLELWAQWCLSSAAASFRSWRTGAEPTLYWIISHVTARISARRIPPNTRTWQVNS